MAQSKAKPIRPDYIFEVSWEVCNRVGGIYAVLSTRARTLQQLFNDKIVFVGPDIWKENESPYFRECETPLSAWAKEVNESSQLNVRVGRWTIPGEPLVVLVDFTPIMVQKNQLFADMWNWYGVDSLRANGDYDESCVFALASALVIESCYVRLGLEQQHVVAHFNEWTVGMGALHIKHNTPAIATLFTTHATSIGRSIACNNKELYKYFDGYFGDVMASELNMEAKHSVEKHAAHEVDCFTTVSEITADECRQMLEKSPAVVTPNAFEMDFVPKGAKFEKRRTEARTLLLKSIGNLIGYTPATDALLVGIGGRYEYKNKGLDVFVDAVNRLRSVETLKREVIALIMVPAWSNIHRNDLRDRMRSRKKHTTPLPNPFVTHSLYNESTDNVLGQIRARGFENKAEDNVKIVFIPVYLTGADGIYNKSYYDLLIGLDMTVFPSYYEPWGYTPMESVAFRVPTVTTDKAGFGIWCRSQIKTKNMDEGVCVVHRDDDNYDGIVEEIAQQIANYAKRTPAKTDAIRTKAQALAAEASWSNFIEYYLEAYDIALKHARKRNKQINK